MKLMLDSDEEAIKYERIKIRIRLDCEKAKNEIDEERHVSRSVVVGRIICFMRKRHQAGNNFPISLSKILIGTNQNFLGGWLRHWLYVTAIPEHPKITPVDGGLRFMYKPTYPIDNFADLVTLLKIVYDENTEGIALADVMESLPNAETILAENQSGFITLTCLENRKKILFYKEAQVQEDGAEALSQNVPEEDISQSVAQYVSQDVPQDVAQNVSEDVPQNVSEDVSQDVAQNESDDVQQNVSEDLPQDVAQIVLQDIPQDVAQNLSQDVPQDVAQDVSQNVSQDVAQALPQDALQQMAEVLKEYLVKCGSQVLLENVPQDVVQNVPLVVPQVLSQNVPQYAPQDEAINLSHNLLEDVVMQVMIPKKY